MGRKGKGYKNVKCIIVIIEGKIVQLNLNSNDRIENEEDLKILPFLSNQNPRRKLKKTSITMKNKNIKQQQQIAKARKEKEQLMIQKTAEDSSNEINEVNSSTDNSNENETSFLIENDQLCIFDEFNEYDDTYFDDVDNETNNIFFNFD